MTEAKEGLWMTAKERDRLKVLHEVSKRYIPQKQAAAELGLSERWVRQLLVRWRAWAMARCGMGCVGEPRTGKRRRR